MDFSSRLVKYGAAGSAVQQPLRIVITGHGAQVGELVQVRAENFARYCHYPEIIKIERADVDNLPFEALAQYRPAAPIARR
jgi:hypothetical protein